MEKVKIGDLVTIPILKSFNVQNNFVLAENFIPKNNKNKIVAEVAGFSKDNKAILVFVPKTTGWNFDSKESKFGEIPLTNFLRYKLFQHNGWWVTTDAIIDIINNEAW